MRLLVVGGGPHHDTAGVTAVLAESLPPAHQLDYTEDLGRLREEHLLAYDVLVLYLLQYSGTGVSLHEAARHGIYAFLAHGRGLIALHCGHASFDDWPGYGRILGGIWEWGKSDHAPFGAVSVRMEQRDHPITRGVNDFTLQDELSHTPTLTAPIEVLATADYAGRCHP
ncbi:MAG TPA: ThuA domain-containing protein, partial [Limnochordia bacterium]|nr:ThuA domain-containing protein [Limnochordia bacterium]